MNSRYLRGVGKQGEERRNWGSTMRPKQDFDIFANSDIMIQSVLGSRLPHVRPSPFLLLTREDILIRPRLETLEGPDSQKSTGGDAVSFGGRDTELRGQMMGWVN